MVIDELVAILSYQMEGEQNLARFQRSLDNIQRSVSVFGQAVGTFVGAIAAESFMRLSSAISSLPGDVISTSATFESLEATLTTIEGSSEKARQSLDWVEKFATTTPYDLQQVSEAFVRLRAYGLDPMDGTLMAVGDAASGMGKSLMEGVEAIADATTGENERLKAFGITASVAGDKVTYTWRENGKEMSKTLKKTGLEVAKFLKDNFGSRFDGAMLRQSKTWNGMTSNLGDAWTNFLKRIGKAGFFDAVKNRLADLLDTVGSLDGEGKIDAWANSISRGLTWLVDQVFYLADRFRRHIKFFSDAIDGLKEFDPSILEKVKLGLAAIAAVVFPKTAAIIVLEDVISYLQGSESVIGDIAKSLSEITGIEAGQLGTVLATITGATAGLILAAPAIRGVAAAIFGLARALGLMGGANVAAGVAAVGAAGTAATGAGTAGAAAGAGAAGAAAAGGMTLLQRIAGAVGLGIAAYEGAQTITSPSQELQNAPRSKTGVDDVLRWIYKQATSGSADTSQNAPAVEQANREAANANFFQAFEDRINNARGNVAKMEAGTAAAAVTNTVNDNSDRSVNVNVGGVTVQGVQNVTGAVGGAVGRAVGQGAASGAQRSLPPTRIAGNTGAF